MATAPFQTKLLPHLDEIRNLRQHRKTYTEIAGILLTTHGLKVAPSTIFAAVKVRSKRSGPISMSAPARPPAVTTKICDPIEKLRDRTNPISRSDENEDLWNNLKPSNEPLK